MEALITRAGGIPLDERLQECDVGATITFAFLSSGRLVDDGGPLRGNNFVSDGRKKGGGGWWGWREGVDAGWR